MFDEKLKRVFSPRSIAVVGASDSFDKLGYHVMRSLIEGEYRGAIYPVSFRSQTVWGLRSYRSVKDIDGEVDLAIIVTPQTFVPEILADCGRKGVSGVVLITAGYRESGKEEGQRLEEEIRRVSLHFNIPIIGPNTFGFVNLTDKVNASFTCEFSLIKEGGLTLISQSGGFCHLIGFLALEERLGMAKIMSLGNRVNVDFACCLKYFLEEDEATKSIALHIEGTEDPRGIFETVERAKRKKPIIAYKAGKNEKGDLASKFHTGSLAGDYRIWKGAFRQYGILEVEDSEELIDTAKVLEVCPPLKGKRIAVLSGQAGPGIIACDALERKGLILARFTERTQEEIDTVLPHLAMRTNPVDMGPAWYNPEKIIRILKIVLLDENTDGIIFINTFASANLRLPAQLRRFLEETEPLPKPVIVCMPSPTGVWSDEIKMIDGYKGVTVLKTPERASRAMANLYMISSFKLC